MLFEKEKYSLQDLKLIAHALQVISKDSDMTTGVVMNMFHVSRFNNKTHYIDYHKAHGFWVYKKFKDWKPHNEQLK